MLWEANYPSYRLERFPLLRGGPPLWDPLEHTPRWVILCTQCAYPIYPTLPYNPSVRYLPHVRRWDPLWVQPGDPSTSIQAFDGAKWLRNGDRVFGPLTLVAPLGVERLRPPCRSGERVGIDETVISSSSALQCLIRGW